MRFRISLLVLCFLILTMGIIEGCASVKSPQSGDVIEKFAGTFEQVCEFWRRVKAVYPQAKAAAITARELGAIDDKTWAAFQRIDEDAPKLDRWLALICERNAGAANEAAIAREREGVDWNAVGENVLRVAVFAMQSGLLK
jgi:hypothetical protein